MGIYRMVNKMFIIPIMETISCFYRHQQKESYIANKRNISNPMEITMDDADVAVMIRAVKPPRCLQLLLNRLFFSYCS